MLEPPESSSVNSNSLSESASSINLPDFGAEFRAGNSGRRIERQLEVWFRIAAVGLVAFGLTPLIQHNAVVGRVAKIDSALAGTAAAGAGPLLFGHRAEIDFVAALGVHLHFKIVAVGVKAQFKLAAIGRRCRADLFLPESDAVSLPDEPPDFGAESLAELPPLMTALPGPAEVQRDFFRWYASFVLLGFRIGAVQRTSLSELPSMTEELSDMFLEVFGRGFVVTDSGRGLRR